MKNCMDYSEQLSAYYDGELSESDALKLKEHLAVCDSCSALLEMYKEISIVTDSELVSVPDALCIGVMNTVKADDLYGPKRAGEKKSSMRIILTRYMPIAACLVVVFFVWSFWGSSFGLGDSAAPRNFSLFGSSSNDAGEPEAIHPPMSVAFDAALPTALPSDSADKGGADDGAQTRDGLTGQGTDPEGVVSLPFPLPEPLPDELFRRSVQSDDSLDEELDTSDIFVYLSGASFWITYTGTLPDDIISLFPESLGSWFGWDVIFELPTEDVEFVIDWLSPTQIRDDLTNFSIIENESRPDSSYAVVFYFAGNE